MRAGGANTNLEYVKNGDGFARQSSDFPTKLNEKALKQIQGLV
jgi:hypothetical protein